MQPIQRVLGAMLNSRSAYETFTRVGDKGDFGGVASLVLDAVRGYYELDPAAQRVDRAIIEERVAGSLSNPKHEAAYRSYLQGIPDDVSGPNVEFDLREVHKQRVGERLAIALTNGAPQEEKEALTQEYQEACKTVGSVSVDEEHGFLIGSKLFSDNQAPAAGSLIHLWPQQLDTHIDGGAGAGNLIVVFARPNTGKTLFGINLCTSFVRQGKRVLYIGNEEPVWRIRHRFVARLLKANPSALRQDPQRAEEVAAKRGANLAAFKLEPYCDARTIERYTKAWRADCVIIDQMHKMKVNADSSVNMLEAQAATCRSLAQNLNVLMIGNTQAGVSASNKAVLDMNDIEGSKTGIAANADLLLGLGKTRDMWDNGMLELAICKNKLGSSHDHFTLNVNKVTGEIT